MAEEERPDPMQAYYLGRQYTPPPAPEDSAPDDSPLPPLADITIRWEGAAIVAAFIVLIALTARALGTLAAQILTMAGLCGLAAYTLWMRRRAAGARREGVWEGQELGPYSGFDGDSADGGGGGGGDG